MADTASINNYKKTQTDLDWDMNSAREINVKLAQLLNFRFL